MSEQDRHSLLNDLQDFAERLKQHVSSVDVSDTASSGEKISDNSRNIRENADIQQRREEMAKQTATSLDHAAACKQTFTDWETRLAKILGDVDVNHTALHVGGQEFSADQQHSPLVDSSTAEWQVCKSTV